MAEENRARELRERAEDEEYWKGIFAANEARKEGQKPAKVSELEEIKINKTGTPLTSNEKRVIDNWNDGKSALNFKWLGR